MQSMQQMPGGAEAMQGLQSMLPSMLQSMPMDPAAMMSFMAGGPFVCV